MRRTIASVAAAFALTMGAACGAEDGGGVGTAGPGAEAETLRPVTASELTDVWLMMPDERPRRLLLTFAADGTFQALDRCNLSDGTWELGPDGELTIVSGPVVQTATEPESQTECPGMLETEPLDALSSAYLDDTDLDGAELVLFGASGDEFGRFGAGRPGPMFPNPGDNGPTDEPTAAPSLPRVPAPLPDELEPVEREELLGSWLPESGEAEGRAFLTFREDGTVVGSDGCNGAGGTWAYGPDDTLVTTTGPSTLIGCENVPVAHWLGEARRAGFDGEVLVLLDQDGTENGRLVRGTPVTSAP